MRLRNVAILLLFVFGGCASGPQTAQVPHKQPEDQAVNTGQSAAPAADLSESRTVGRVSVDISNQLGAKLPAAVELHGSQGRFFVVDAPTGVAEDRVPTGAYEAFVQVYSEGVPILVDVKPIEVTEGGNTPITVSVLEGSAGVTPLWRFDTDCDLAMDRVEMAYGTNPYDASSIPGRRRVPFSNQSLSGEAGWLRGELHAHSVHGIGKESVGELIRRAERLGLDFLAITDRNTMAACLDSEYRSDKLILIPAMEWGNDDQGTALLYGPRTFPEVVDSKPEAEAVFRLVWAQGGVTVAAHPCFPGSSWQWGISMVNGVQVWCRDWRGIPGITLEALRPELRQRNPDGELVHSIALAAGRPAATLSANAQAARYWDYELVRGFKTSAYAGSSTASPQVPMAEPVTYVYAREKSLRGVLAGMQAGHTFVSSSLDGPQISISADVGDDDRIDVGMGGLVPIGVQTKFEVRVDRAEGQKLEVLLNGRIIISKVIESDGYVHQFIDLPEAYTVYRARIIRPSNAAGPGFGPSDVLAMTSPIYAQDLFIESERIPLADMWIRLKSDLFDPDKFPDYVPPSNPAASNARELVPQLRF